MVVRLVVRLVGTRLGWGSRTGTARTAGNVKRAEAAGAVGRVRLGRQTGTGTAGTGTGTGTAGTRKRLGRGGGWRWLRVRGAKTLAGIRAAPPRAQGWEHGGGSLTARPSNAPKNTNLPIPIGAETTEAKEASEGATAPDRATERGRARHPPTKHKRRFRVLPPSSPSHTATILDVVNGLLSLHVSCGRWWLCGGMGFGRIFQPPKSPFSLKKTKKSRFFLKKAKKEVPVFGT